MRTNPLIPGALAILGVLLASQPVGGVTGDPDVGAQLFRTCAACHSLKPDRHRTGPSLAGIWGKKAGSVEGFQRYSPALKAANLAWTAQTLDPWLADPQGLIPGNRMTMRGIDDAQARADLIAYLEIAAAASEGGPEHASRGGMRDDPGDLPDLKALGPEHQVEAIRYCGDTYHVTTAAGEALPFWEFNLRFKTDSSERGPRRGQPALLPASMMGDRAFVIFAAPEEISALIESRC
jgi:cytochrome c